MKVNNERKLPALEALLWFNWFRTCPTLTAAVYKSDCKNQPAVESAALLSLQKSQQDLLQITSVVMVQFPKLESELASNISSKPEFKATTVFILAVTVTEMQKQWSPFFAVPLA